MQVVGWVESSTGGNSSRVVESRWSPVYQVNQLFQAERSNRRVLYSGDGMRLLREMYPCQYGTRVFERYSDLLVTRYPIIDGQLLEERQLAKVLEVQPVNLVDRKNAYQLKTAGYDGRIKAYPAIHVVFIGESPKFYKVKYSKSTVTRRIREHVQSEKHKLEEQKRQEWQNLADMKQSNTGHREINKWFSLYFDVIYDWLGVTERSLCAGLVNTGKVRRAMSKDTNIFDLFFRRTDIGRLKRGAYFKARYRNWEYEVREYEVCDSDRKRYELSLNTSKYDDREEHRGVLFVLSELRRYLKLYERDQDEGETGAAAAD